MKHLWTILAIQFIFIGNIISLVAQEAKKAVPIPGKQVLVSTKLVPNTLKAFGPGQKPVENFQSVPEGTLQDIHYWLFFPKTDSARSEAGYPLILFMHGIGERGTDADRVKVIGLPHNLEDPAFIKDFPFIVVSPQCPDDCWWSPIQMFALLDEVCREQPIDPTRIYVTGLSWGGFGTWSMIQTDPNRLAAAVPICGGSMNLKQLEKAVNLPVWAFHGDADSIVRYDMSIDAINAIKKAGGIKTKLTLYHGIGHDCWTQTYRNPELYQWLLKQSATGNKK